MSDIRWSSEQFVAHGEVVYWVMPRRLSKMRGRRGRVMRLLWRIRHPSRLHLLEEQK